MVTKDQNISHNSSKTRAIHIYIYIYNCSSKKIYFLEEGKEQYEQFVKHSPDKWRKRTAALLLFACYYTV